MIILPYLCYLQSTCEEQTTKVGDILLDELQRDSYIFLIYVFRMANKVPAKAVYIRT